MRWRALLAKRSCFTGGFSAVFSTLKWLGFSFSGSKLVLPSRDGCEEAVTMLPETSLMMTCPPGALGRAVKSLSCLSSRTDGWASLRR
jgi:hypothetical protein